MNVFKTVKCKNRTPPSHGGKGGTQGHHKPFCGVVMSLAVQNMASKETQYKKGQLYLSFLLLQMS